VTDATNGSPPAAPVCPRHPDRVSYVRCQRCERPACPQCQIPAPVGVLCVDCAREADKASSAARARAAAATGQGRGRATIALIAMNVAFYLYGLSTGMAEWQVKFGLIPGFGVHEPWRWITSGFVHSSPANGGLLHIGLNMLMLYQFGRQLELVLGWKRFVALYGLSLVGGSAAIVLLAKDMSLHLGASGAVFGLFAAFGVVLYRRKLPWQSLAASAGIWLVAGFVIPNISWQGHLGGAIVGGVTMLVMLMMEETKSRR